MTAATILVGDCRARMTELAPCSVDSVVCDPPYELGFMGKGWDKTGIACDVAMWAEVLRVLKPGGHLVAFSGTRTYHRMACAIEEAGFEVRDQLAWVYGSGFPKSHDISKQIDRAAGAEREVVGRVAGMGKQNPQWNGTAQGRGENSFKPEYDATAPATDDAREWQGWGTALKPSWEPICLARKPISEKNIAANVLKHGTGAINVNGCRIEHGGEEFSVPQSDPAKRAGAVGSDLGISGASKDKFQDAQRASIERTAQMGRWPSNLAHDGSDEVLAGFPDAGASGKASGPSLVGPSDRACMAGGFGGTGAEQAFYGDSGSAARFFYCAKTTTEERGDGNNHPTVKPIALMQWLVRLVTPKGGTVLDPFMGSGSTIIAATAGQFNAIGCELSDAYVDIAVQRIRAEAGLFAQVEVKR